MYTHHTSSMLQATIEEKLALLRGNATDKPTEITGPTDSLATVLSQALQSDDVSMLKVRQSS